MKKKKWFYFAGCLLAAAILLRCDSDWPYKPTQFITPVYVPPALANVTSFVGTSNAKIAFTLDIQGGRWIYFADYSASSAPLPQKLKKPAGKERGYHTDSPLLSPDGKWVTYFFFQIGSGLYQAYVQRLDTTSEPVLIASPASDPHWWVDSLGGWYIVYSNKGGFITGDIEAIQGGLTLRQKVDSTNPTLTIDNPDTLAPYPFTGGLSKDGKYLCTGYERAYFYDVAAKSLTAINPGKQTCNPSITPDTIITDQLMFLNIQGVQQMTNSPFGDTSIAQHRVIFIVDKSNTVIKYFDHKRVFSSPKQQWQDPEWSSNPDFLATTIQNADNSWSGYLIKISTGDTLRFNGQVPMDETSTPYLWLGN